MRLQTGCERFCMPIKGKKQKTTKKKNLLSLSSGNHSDETEGPWIDIETRETFSLCVRSFQKKVISSSSSFSASTSRRRWGGSLLERIKEKSSETNSHSLFIGRTIVGKHVWQQEEEQKRRYPVLQLMISGKIVLSPSSSRTFRTQIL